MQAGVSPNAPIVEVYSMPTVPPSAPLASAQLTLADEDATNTLAFELAKGLHDLPLPFAIHLHGDLGAGKTSFARALLRGAGVEGRIKSPTYALVEVYVNSGLNFYHFDFYRLKDPDEWHESGFRDSLSEPAVSLMEWPEKALGAGVPLPPADLEIFLRAPSPETPSLREIQLMANTSSAATFIAALTS